MNKAKNIYLFKLTLNICKIKNALSFFFKSLHKRCPFFKEL
jgi:hypothetical protein